uniref:Uncharacterized protein n=1 Tax=Arundo donax TaxID=35708 RepID=A0A0A9DWM1_ARUDO
MRHFTRPISLCSLVDNVKESWFRNEETNINYFCRWIIFLDIVSFFY